MLETGGVLFPRPTFHVRLCNLYTSRKPNCKLNDAVLYLALWPTATFDLFSHHMSADNELTAQWFLDTGHRERCIMLQHRGFAALRFA